jgi:hypothetical protein
MTALRAAPWVLAYLCCFAAEARWPSLWLAWAVVAGVTGMMAVDATRPRGGRYPRQGTRR